MQNHGNNKAPIAEGEDKEILDAVDFVTARAPLYQKFSISTLLKEGFIPSNRFGFFYRLSMVLESLKYFKSENMDAGILTDLGRRVRNPGGYYKFLKNEN